jgi:hypothetical protein
MKKREKWAVVRDTTGGGTEFIIGFEGSQALLVCPSGKCKLLTGTIEYILKGSKARLRAKGHGVCLVFFTEPNWLMLCKI